MSEFITDTTDATFEADVLNSDLPVLLDLWAPWCGPCKALAPHLERIAKEHQGCLRVVKYDIDQSRDPNDACARFGVRGIPALLVFRAGVEVARSLGASPAKLRAMADTALSESEPDAGVRMRSFDGDVKRKESCIARLESAIRAGDLKKTGAGEVEQRPSVCASGDKNADYNLKFGVPAALAVLQDYFFATLPADGSDVHFALEWIEAIPVGADLTGIPSAFAKWLAIDPAWGVARWTLEQDNEWSWLPKAVVDLHGRNTDSEPVSSKEWAALHDQCTQAKQDAQQPFVRQVIGNLMGFTKGLAYPGGLKLIELSGGLDSLAESHVSLNWWTDSEKALIEGRQTLLGERVAALGPKPVEGSDVFEARRAQVSAIAQEVYAAFAAKHPEIQERQTAMHEAMRHQSAAFCVAQAQVLLNLLRTAPEASVG